MTDLVTCAKLDKPHFCDTHLSEDQSTGLYCIDPMLVLAKSAVPVPKLSIEERLRAISARAIDTCRGWHNDGGLTVNFYVNAAEPWSIGMTVEQVRARGNRRWTHVTGRTLEEAVTAAEKRLSEEGR